MLHQAFMRARLLWFALGPFNSYNWRYFHHLSILLPPIILFLQIQHFIILRVQMIIVQNDLLLTLKLKLSLQWFNMRVEFWICFDEFIYLWVQFTNHRVQLLNLTRVFLQLFILVFELPIQLIYLIALLSKLLIFEGQFFIFVENRLTVDLQGAVLLICFLFQLFQSFSFILQFDFFAANFMLFFLQFVLFPLDFCHFFCVIFIECCIGLFQEFNFLFK